MNPIDRYKGCLIGLAVGDALGASVEFKPPGTFEPVTEMRGGGPWQLPAGYWTDDTSMALCLAASLVEGPGFDPLDQMQRYWDWYTIGYMSSIDKCFDIGSTCRTALQQFAATGDPIAGPMDPETAGNGSLMRLAPIPLYYSRYPELAIEFSALSSQTTHRALAAIDACRYFAWLIIQALHEKTKEDILAWPNMRLLNVNIGVISDGSFKFKEPPEIKGTGYVVDCLEAALWAFYHGNSFEECVLKAVNLGDDADTTGAVCGQLAGAYYGIQGIPEAWRQQLHRYELIEGFADALYDERM